MANAGARPQAAGPRAQPVPGRYLSRSEHPQGRRHTARACPGQLTIPPRNARDGRAGRHLRAYRRSRHRARGRGRLLRARGQSARSVGRIVHAGEPADDDAPVSRAVCDPGDQARRALSRFVAGEPPRRRAGGRGTARSGRAHAGRAQLRVFRARVPRPADGRRAGRGPGSIRAERDCIHAHDPWSATRSRPVPQGR